MQIPPYVIRSSPARRPWALPARALLCTLCGVLLLALLGGCSAVDKPDPSGPSGFDAEAYRTKKEAATDTFLDPARPAAERIEAAEDLGYPEEETFDALLAVASNPAEPDAVRQTAFDHHRFDRAWIEAVLAVLSDPADGGPELNAHLVMELGRRSIQVPDDLEPKIITVLRVLLDDPRDPVRLAAYRILVASSDTVAVTRLTDALRANAPPIPLDEAIRLLDVNGPNFHVDVVRPFLGSGDVAVQAEAARVLAVDPESRAQVVKLVLNRETPQRVRLRGIRALAREDEAYLGYGLRLVSNRSEDPDVRLAAMHAYVGRLNYQPSPRQVQIEFAKVVESLANPLPSSTSEVSKADAELRAQARRLFVYLKKAFPAVAAHYAGS